MAKRSSSDPSPAADVAEAVDAPASDPVADAPAEESSESAPAIAPLRRWFAGGGHIPELGPGYFLGSGAVLAEQQPDGTWRLVQEDAPPAEESGEQSSVPALADSEEPPQA